MRWTSRQPPVGWRSTRSRECRREASVGAWMLAMCHLCCLLFRRNSFRPRQLQLKLHLLTWCNMNIFQMHHVLLIVLETSVPVTLECSDGYYCDALVRTRHQITGCVVSCLCTALLVLMRNSHFKLRSSKLSLRSEHVLRVYLAQDMVRVTTKSCAMPSRVLLRYCYLTCCSGRLVR